ncbi:MAG: adenylate/guanylate cyclase domain-containing protein [Bacteroidota bacterium]
MKTNLLLTTLGVLLFFSVPGLSQNARVQQLEQEIAKASGLEKVEKSIALSDTYLAMGEYKKAVEIAEDAEENARKSGSIEWRATALNRQGKALMLNGKKGFFGREPAAPKFIKSNEILRSSGVGNKSLILDNLVQLRIIAEKRGRTEEVQELESQITQVQKSNLPSQSNAPTSNVASTPNSRPNAAPSQSQEEKLMKESQALQSLLAEKEAAISVMTEAQVKTKLILLQQEQMLDSLAYRSRLDSFSVANWNLALREAESSRNFNYAIMAVLLLVAGGSAFSYFRARQNAIILGEKNKIIREEQQRSDNLLLNILPGLVAEELKQKGRTNARFFEDVSVLFADFVGFSKIAEQLSPQQLVTELDTCFQAFDEIISKHGLEKIKTIGDAYMCAGGLPNGGGSQLRAMVTAAKEMQLWLHEWNTERDKKGQPRFDARIGIHSGPVVAGVVGSRKFAFDIWGDTVNIAARVEQAGEGGKINISGEAYAIVNQFFPCHYRGKIAVKNKGEIDMYFVEN